MAWGTAGNINTTNLSDGTKSPALARANLFDALNELLAVINGRNTASGVAGLDASSKILNTQLPNTITSSAAQDLLLDPNTDKVNIEHILNLNPQTVAQLNARTDITQGDVAICSDGDTGVLCIAIASGETDSAGNPEWRRISLGATISAT
jgi:hypothetical protein